MDDQNAEIAILNKKLMQVSGGFRQAILILTANREGLFDLLNVNPATIPLIAAKKVWDERATGIFMNALVSLGFLQKSGDHYSNTEISQELLVSGSPHYQGDILKHNWNLLEFRWMRLEEVLKSGQPVGAVVADDRGERLHNFIAGMANSARLLGESLWSQVDLNGRKRLLDVGGGPGSYAFEACQKFPGLQAVVFDLPEVEPIFQEYRNESNVGERVVFQAGDYLKTTLPSGFNAVLLSNIIHSLGKNDNLTLLTKIREALVPDGLLVLKDFFISPDGTQPLWTALFAVNMLLGTDAGTTYSREGVESWFQQTGFTLVRAFDLTEQTGVLIAKKVA
jgi:SAM-dependent methyltransferase